jgi:hypothetical protein
MNNLPIQTYESVVQQRDALAAENKALIEQAEEVYAAGYNHGHLNTVDGIAYSAGTKDEFYQLAIELMNEAETQATDSFLAGVQAQGVDKLAIFAGKEYQRFVGDKPAQRKWKGVVMLCTDFAAQLRKGINDAQ